MFKLYYTTINNDILRCGRKLKGTDDNDKTIIDRCNDLLSKTGKQYNYYKVHKNNIIKDIFETNENKDIYIQDESGTNIGFTHNIDYLVSSTSQVDINISKIFDKGVVDKIMKKYTSDTNQFHKDIELNPPRKTDHYIWWVYPQLESINYFLKRNIFPSQKTKDYGFESIYTAFRYLLSNYPTFKKNYDVIRNNPNFFKTGKLPDDIQKFDSSIKLFMLVAKMIQNEELLQYLQEILNRFYQNNTSYINNLKKSNITQQVIDKQYLLIGNDKKNGDEKLSFDLHIRKMKFVENRKHTSSDASKLKTNYYHPVNILFQENFKIVEAGILEDLREIDGTTSSPFKDVIVDPAQNKTLIDNTIEENGGASKAIYDRYNIKKINYNKESIILGSSINDSIFTNSLPIHHTFGGLIATRQYISTDGIGIEHQNFDPENGKIVIHVTGPIYEGWRLYHDGVMGNKKENFLNLLTYCYKMVFLEFIKIIKTTTTKLKLRLLPISGAIFAGSFRKDVHYFTLFCIARAYDNLSLDYKFELDRSTIKLCIFDKSEQTKFTVLHKDIKQSTEHLYTFFKNNTFLNEFLTPPEILQKLINPELST